MYEAVDCCDCCVDCELVACASFSDILISQVQLQGYFELSAVS
jgi:hypothetical protein